jgi:hypothetical protein
MTDLASGESLVVNLFVKRVDTGAQFCELRSVVDVRCTRLGGLVDIYLAEEQLSLPRSRVRVQLACCGTDYMEDSPPRALVDPSRSLYDLGITETAWLLFSLSESPTWSPEKQPPVPPDVVALLSQHLRQVLPAKQQFALRFHPAFAPDREALIAGHWLPSALSKLLRRLENVVHEVRGDEPERPRA